MYSLTHSLTSHWKLRIHLEALVPDTCLTSCRAFAETLDEGFVFAIENEATRPHLQAGFSYKTERPDTIKKILKKYFQFDPNITKLTNSHWSCTLDKEPETWFRYMNYLTKEEVVLSSYTETQIQEMNSAYWKENAQIIKTQTSAKNKRQKDKSIDRNEHYQNIINKIDNENLLKEIPEEEFEVDPRFDEYVGTHPTTCPTTRAHYTVRTSGKEFKTIISIILDEYKDTYFTTTMLEPLINRVMSHYYPEYWKRVLQEKLISRFFKEF